MSGIVVIHVRRALNVQLHLLRIAPLVLDADTRATHGLFVGVRLLVQHLLCDALVQLACEMRLAVVVVGKVPVALDTVKHAQTRDVRVQLGRRLELLALGGHRRVFVALVLVEVTSTRTRSTRNVCVSSSFVTYRDVRGACASYAGPVPSCVGRAAKNLDDSTWHATWHHVDMHL